MENELKLIVPSFHQVTRSYAKKVNLANHIPNHDYESVDFFSSHNEQVPMGTPQEEIDALGVKLFSMAKNDVDIAEANVINAMKREAGIAVEPTGDDYKAIADIIVAFESSVTKEDVSKATEMVTGMKDKLNETQLEYLRHIARKAGARALK